MTQRTGRVRAAPGGVCATTVDRLRSTAGDRDAPVGAGPEARIAGGVTAAAVL